jgi:hypothetical protein
MQDKNFDPRDFRDVGLPEGEVYPGFWWVQWSGRQTGSFVVKHLHFRLLLAGGVSRGDDWLLDGLTHDPGGDFICGASPAPDGSSPTLSFMPDHKGRAHAVYTDTHGEGVVTLTSLGNNLLEGLTGYPLDIDRDSEAELIQSLNRFTFSERRVHLDEVTFELEAPVGAFVDEVWSIRILLSTSGTGAEVLGLDGVAITTRRKARTPRVAQRMLDMAEFEGYREFGPLDSSASNTLPLRSLAAATEAINTPIPLDTAFLQLLKEPGDDYLSASSDIPRALFIASLMVVGAERTGVGRARSEDWLEALDVARWVLALSEKVRFMEQRELIEVVFGAVASLDTAEQAETLFEAELFVAADSEPIDARFPGLLKELKHLRVQMLWRIRRDELISSFHALIEDMHEKFEVSVESRSESSPVVFTVDLLSTMMVQVKPRIHVPRRKSADSQQEAEYWLQWEPDFSMDNGMSIHLNHDLVQMPEVVAGIITHTIKHRKGITPEEMTWGVTPL